MGDIQEACLCILNTVACVPLLAVCGTLLHELELELELESLSFSLKSLSLSESSLVSADMNDGL